MQKQFWWEIQIPWLVELYRQYVLEDSYNDIFFSSWMCNSNPSWPNIYRKCLPIDHTFLYILNHSIIIIWSQSQIHYRETGNFIFTSKFIEVYIKNISCQFQYVKHRLRPAVSFFCVFARREKQCSGSRLFFSNWSDPKRCWYLTPNRGIMLPS